MSDDLKPSHPPGTACIKSEYLMLDHVRELNINFVAYRDKRSLDTCNPENTEESKKKKLKGQNKHRPRGKRAPKCTKLCFSIGTKGFCSYGDSCCYSHDVDAYLSTKPADISETCYFFESFGNCPYSFSCRFASKHIANGKNVINEKLWSQFKDKRLVFNVLDKDLQRSLRKHAYDFSRTEKVLKAMASRNTSHCSKDSVSHSDMKTVSAANNILSESESASTDKNRNCCDTSENKTVCNSTQECKIELSEESSNVTKLHDVCENSKSQTSEDIEKFVENSNICRNVDLINEKSLVDVENKFDFGTNMANNVKLSGRVTEGEISYSSSEINDVENSRLPLPIEEDIIKLRPSEIKKVDFRGKLYLAPLTTVGNLPFRRICKEFGVDITCGEMAMAMSLLQGHQSEWALLKRHHTEDLFGIQLCGAYPDLMTKCGQLLTETISIDFIDVNMGCPLDLVYRKGAGCGLMNRLKKFDEIILGMSSVMDVPLTVKMRSGVYANEHSAHNVIQRIHKWGDCVSLITVHGRSREQRYTKSADWSYINRCAEIAHPIPLFGSGDILSYEDYNSRLKETKVSGALIARGALIKPWIFNEIKEQRHWDISSGERMDMLRSYVNYGLEHWGSDSEGVEKTRRFLLEWLSFLHRYIPVGLLEYLPQQINKRPPPYHGRNDLETLMASPSCGDWIKISEMLLGPVPENFIFLPKHKANAYQ